MTNATDRARAAYALAEAAEHPRDKAALRAAARAWEQIARAGVAFSLLPLRRDLLTLKRETAAATGPFRAPAPIAQPVERGEPASFQDLVERAAARQGIAF